jgi:hypothetical protein
MKQKEQNEQKTETNLKLLSRMNECECKTIGKIQITTDKKQITNWQQIAVQNQTQLYLNKTGGQKLTDLFLQGLKLL